MTKKNPDAVRQDIFIHANGAEVRDDAMLDKAARDFDSNRITADQANRITFKDSVLSTTRSGVINGGSQNDTFSVNTSVARVDGEYWIDGKAGQDTLLLRSSDLARDAKITTLGQNRYRVEFGESSITIAGIERIGFYGEGQISDVRLTDLGTLNRVTLEDAIDRSKAEVLNRSGHH